MLTNESIKITNTIESEKSFLRKMIAIKRDEEKKKILKRQMQMKSYKESKKRRTNNREGRASTN